MAMQTINPISIMTPFNNAYVHGVLVPPNARVLHTAGQIGMAPDGSIAADAAAQAEQLWLNLMAILRAAQMSARDIVKLTTYFVAADHYPAYAAARARHLGGHKPASTAVCVAQLLKPEWLMEVEMIAAQAS